MSSKTSIEWAANRDGSPGATWNPIRGCSRISEGCRNCYAERMAARFCGLGDVQEWSAERRSPFFGFAVRTSSGNRWTGRVELIPEMLEIPIKRKKPTTYFVNSMSDLFHEALSDEAIDRVFAVMALCPQHRFIVLTKRARRMREYLDGPSARDCYGRVLYWANVLRGKFPKLRLGDIPISNPTRIPMKHVILGVSCEDQAAADERIPHLLATPAACRMVSLEPLLGPINLYSHIPTLEIERETRTVDDRYLDWLIVGGESGPGARPMHPDWARSLRDQCTAAAVPFFFKQYGEWAPIEAGKDSVFMAGAVRDGSLGPERLKWLYLDGSVATLGHGHHIPEPEVMVARVGKKAAGRLLDGRVWDERPEVLR